MKKTIVFLTLLALVALPATAMSAKTGDFEIGGYVKLHTWWDSTSVVNKNIGRLGATAAGANGRNTAFRPSHEGRFRMTSQDTRFNFKIKGPEVWGAKTQGYIEVDFDGRLGQDPGSNVTNAVEPRLRHAWFRMDWPGGWQVLMGQYWGVFCNYWPDTVNSGPLFGHGMSTQRLPQIRVSYTTGPWTFIGLAGTPVDVPSGGDPAVAAVPFVGPGNALLWPGTGAYQGGRTSMPQFGVQAIFEKDLYGKAAFFSRPRGFSASVSFGIQRAKYDAGGALGAATWGQNNYGGTIGILQEDQTVTPWMLQGSMFIPVLTTQTQDLKNTASLQVQFYVGQGLTYFGNGFDTSYWEWDAPQTIAGFPLGTWNRKLWKEYGGYIQAQYYFTNEWYVSYVYGFSKKYGVNMDRNAALFGITNQGYEFATTVDPLKFIQEHNFSLFYRPNANFKFGLSYVYLNQNYFQNTTNVYGTNDTSRGDNHRIQFAGWFFF